MDYEEIISIDDGVTVVGIRRLSDGACIPLHEDNIDYREYLASLEETA